MLGMRVILREDDDAFARMYALSTDNATVHDRRTAVRGYRQRLDETMAASIREANGGRSLYQVVAEARRRIRCAPVPASTVSDPHGDGAETVTVRVRCMFPEIRRIEDGTPRDVAGDEIVPGTNRRWASYLQDLGGPAVVPIDFIWTLRRTPGARAPKWRTYPFVVETNMVIAELALSPRTSLGGTADHVDSQAGHMHAHHGLEQHGTQKE